MSENTDLETDFAEGPVTESLRVPLAPGKVSVSPTKKLIFERNEGQTDAAVMFLARGRGYTLFLTREGAVLSLKDGRDELGRGGMLREAEKFGLVHPAVSIQMPKRRHLEIRLAGANTGAGISGEKHQRGVVNYLVGNNPAAWLTHVPTFGQVRCPQAYPGIDVVYHAREGDLEFDLVVNPGADPRQIALDIFGAERVTVDTTGDLLLAIDDQEVRWPKPLIFQELAGRRVEIAGGYRVQDRQADGALASGRRVVFALATYDLAYPLIIDPKIIYSTYLGGTGGDAAYSVASDSEGNAFVTGETESLDFPIKNALFSQSDGHDVFVSKYSRTGEVLFTTFIGGTTGSESPIFRSLEVNSGGDCWVAGRTTSTDFPTVNAVQPMNAGGNQDGFLLKLSSDGGSLLASTYIGGSDSDTITALALGPSGDVYAVGRTYSADFPTLNGFQMEMSRIDQTPGTELGSGFVARYSADGKSLIFATYKPRTTTVAERPNDLIVDTQGNAYSVSYLYANPGLTGWQLSKVDADGSRLLYNRNLGPFPPPLAPAVMPYPCICILPNQQVVIGGETFRRLQAVNAPNPTMTSSDPHPEAYLAKYDAATGNFLTGFYLGGNGDDSIVRIFPSQAGNITVVGSTIGKPLNSGSLEFSASGFPVTDSFEPNLVVGKTSGLFVTELTANDFTICYSTVISPFGALGAAPDRFGDVLFTGTTQGGFPTVNAAQSEHAGGRDAFMLRLHIPRRLSVTPTGPSLVLSWPLSISEVVLESTTSVGLDTVWQQVPITPVISGTQQTVEIRPEGSARFFRLREDSP